MAMTSPWHVPLASAPNFRPKVEAPKPSLLKHLSSINIHGKPCAELQTGIMFEIGTNNMEPTAIQRLIAVGATIARINVGEMEQHTCSVLIQSIRQAVCNYSQELEYVYPFAVIIEICGPNIITGNLKNGPKATLEIVQPGNIRLTNDTDWRECGTADCLYIGCHYLADLQRGDIVFINSLPEGKIKLVVEEVGEDSIDCRVVKGGIIGRKMPVQISHITRDTRRPSNISDSDNITPCNVDEEDTFEHVEDQVAFAVASDADALIIPRTQNKYDIQEIRDLLSKKGKHILIFACIDTVVALDNIDDILTEADGIYFDRCILSTDLEVEKIFVAQKVVIAKCKSIGKPCICKAVLNEEVVALCVTDIANMVLDGADVLAFEFYYDSHLKKLGSLSDPLRSAQKCLAAANVICRQAERIKWPIYTFGNIEMMQNSFSEPCRAICASGVDLAVRSRAAVIICVTNSGRVAKILSYLGPPCPIVAVTRICHSARQLRFWRGVRTLHHIEEPKEHWIEECASRVQAALDYCKLKRIVCAGDPYVILSPSHRNTGYCDSMRLFYATAKDIIVVK